ncbi:MAG: hypothetical protein KC419_03865 [Anaerolineales bacterium]|nr:hypothetical protein [Anaerolineales bacterium]
MSNQHEVERIKQVYGRYQRDPHIQAQWDSQNPGNQAILAKRPGRWVNCCKKMVLIR